MDVDYRLIQIVSLAGCASEVATLNKHAQNDHVNGFKWEAGVSSPGCLDPNQDCMIVIIGNFQPDTLDRDGSFKLGKDNEILHNQTMQFATQTVPRIMGAVGDIKPRDVQQFIRSCFIIDKFPMRSRANSSKGVPSSSLVRRRPCPEGMTEDVFVEVRLVL